MKVAISYKFKDGECHNEIIEVDVNPWYTFTNGIHRALDDLSKKYIWRTEDVVEFSFKIMGEE